MASDVETSFAELLESGQQRLASAVPEPRREAFDILAGLTGGSLQVVLDRPQSRSADLERRFWTAVERRANGEPMAYVLGSINFRGYDLRVDSSVLIPRPETEGLVDVVLEAVGGRSNLTAWDVGTGSGCIAISLAGEVGGTWSRVFATDVSPRALDVARQNAVSNSVSGIEFGAGSLLDPPQPSTVDVIVSNPPYIARNEMGALDRSVRDFEPTMALVSADAGMWHIRQLLRHGGDRLNRMGFIALEIDSRRATEALNAACQFGWLNPVITSDVFDRPRYLLAFKSEVDQ